ncbi:MAG: hypothetical protein GY842_12120 [bacterium]|nr:hypothetical protein [bacterium]
MRSFWVSATLVMTLTIGGGMAQPFIGPFPVNNNAGTDSQNDHAPTFVADSRGNFHAVWISSEPMLGSGVDTDVFYSHGTSTGWATPELVNTNGTIDGATTTDLEPALAVDSDGVLHCVWVTNEPFAGSSSDTDILYAQRTSAGWSAPELVDATYATTDSGNGRRPAITAGDTGTIHVAWETNSPTISSGTIGADWDILYSARTASTWSTVTALNANATTDTGDDGSVAMTTAEDGTIIAAWSTNEPTNIGSGPLGADYDIVWSQLPISGTWATPFEVCQEMRSDPVPAGHDSHPTVASIGAGTARIDHFAWNTWSGAWGNGTDSDIAHASWGNAVTIPVLITGTLVNAHATTDGAGDTDLDPFLLVEPGGVIHCFWESAYAGLFGTDSDIFHATSGTDGRSWSPLSVANLNGLIDGGATNDLHGRAARSPAGLIALAWESNDDLGATINTDSDILGGVGLGRQISAPMPINTTASFDTSGPVVDWDYDGDIGMTATGTLHAVWSSNATGLSGAGDYDIFHASRGAAGWSAPALVNSNYGAVDAIGDDDNSPRLLIDSGGTLHVAWASSYNLSATAGTDADIFYSSSSGSGWSAPVVLNSTATTDGAALDFDFALAISPSDEMHAVWTSDANIDGAGTSDFDIIYSVNTGSGWSVAELVNTAYGTTDTATETDRTADIAIDLNGVPHVAWASKALHASAGADADVFYSTRLGGTWSAPEFVNTVAAADGAEDTVPAIAITSDAIPHVVWESDIDNGSGVDTDIWMSSRTGGTWGAATLFNTTGNVDGVTELDSNPDVAVDILDILHVAWQSGHNLSLTAGTDDDILYAYALEPGTATPGISAPLLANPSGHDDAGTEDDQNPTLVVLPDGIAHFAWSSDATLGGDLGVDYDFLHSELDLVITTSPMVVDHLSNVFPLVGWPLRRADANNDGVVDAADVVTLVNQKH